jgi:hypothetical protein
MDGLGREKRRFWQLTGATILVLVILAAVFVVLVLLLYVSAVPAT